MLTAILAVAIALPTAGRQECLPPVALTDLDRFPPCWQAAMW